MASLGAEMRNRRPPSGPSSSSVRIDELTSDNYDNDKPSYSSSAIGWGFPFIVLAVARMISARSNLIHDCDEVFNYWEPLHYLLYKSGFQTWEYSAKFALRSYLYLLLHGLPAAPVSWLLGSGNKVPVFFFVRLILGLISAISETILVVAISQKYGRRLAMTTLVLLAFTAGCFVASTSFLPSTFSMYGITLGSAALLLDKHDWSVALATVAVFIGWPFSILCTVPMVVYALIKGNFKKAFLAGAATSAFIMILSILTDYYYYGRLTSSVVNLFTYNVMGGGKSHLYGVEGPLFYLKNSFNNFNITIFLSLLCIPVIFLTRKKHSTVLMVVVSPVYLWLLFMSLQAHKEERFLYPVYPLICLAAAAAVERFPDIVKRFLKVNDESVPMLIAKFLRPVVLGFILVLSHSRTVALLNGYSAPITVYRTLAGLENIEKDSVLCVGNEWHRYPSSFFLPANVSQVKWLDEGFRGLLPIPFNETLGGTASSPTYFNDLNKATDKQFVSDISTCTFLVELQLDRGYPSLGSDSATWETITEISFLDKQKSPPFYRGFMVPGSWEKMNVFGKYKLLKRKPQVVGES